MVQVYVYTPGDMLNGILEENQLGLLGKGHVVIIEVVLEDSLDLIHVCQILIQAILFLCTHLQGFTRRKAERINKSCEVFQCKVIKCFLNLSSTFYKKI